MIVLVDYASPSVFESTRDDAALALATNLRRPVRFHGVVRRERASIEDHPVGLAELGQFRLGRVDEHVPHEQRMVRPRANHAAAVQ